MKDSAKEYSPLRPAQQTAVDAAKGPVLVIAGAGTGKTRVLVERIAKLIENGTEPKRILALTFTEKAAAEMLDRLNLLRGAYELEMPVMTFNAYGESVLRRYAADIGLGRNFSVMGANAQIVFLRERLDSLGLDYFAPVSRPDGLLGSLAEYFSKLKQNIITPEAYIKHASALPAGDRAERLNKAKYDELGKAYKAYMQLCLETNVIDYDDQIYQVIELFSRRPNILKEIQESYDFVLVDEFQDTNAMQSKLIDQVAARHQNLFVVGDDDQSIYGWRGATLANILNFKTRYPKSKEITLIENYRSTQAILDCAYRLVTHNNPHRLEARLKINKKLISNKTGPPPEVHGFEMLDEELQWIAEDIAGKLASGAKPGSIAVLARRNITIQKLRPYLEYAGVEYVVIGQSYELYHEAAVRILLEAIKATVDPLDNISLYHTLTGPLFSLPPMPLSKAAAQARKEHASLHSVIEASTDDDLGAARQSLTLIDGWRELSVGVTVGKLAYEIIDSTGYKDRLYNDPALAVSGTRLSELFGTFREFEKIALQPTAIQYVEALPALQAAGEGLSEDGTLDLSESRVNLLTIHKSKGLEWPAVYIADCTEGSFPVRKSPAGIALPDGLDATINSEADEHIYEERRLMYVAMTRAKDRLTMTYADKHSGVSSRKPSRFLSEAFGEINQARNKPGGKAMTTAFDSFTSASNTEVTVPERILKNEQVNLSVSQAVSYMACPLNFYYQYVLNVPQEPDPALEYGSIMHMLLQDINNSLMAGKQPDLKALEERLASEWPKIGYLSASQRERAYKQAQTTLKNIYERVIGEPRIPLAVEEPFAIVLKDFKLAVNGRFDAVFPLGDGVEIVDYKTSTRVDSPEKAKQRASASDQLTLYALAWQQLHDELPALVTLDFIDTGMTGSIKKTARGIEGARSRLQRVADGIRQQDFTPGNDHLFCIHPPL